MEQKILHIYGQLVNFQKLFKFGGFKVGEIYEIKASSLDEIRSLQMKSLEILLYFKDFCEKHNLLFYFCGGCCIGAIRHKGFIPWDDDIDVFMPRQDYEKLAELWEKDADIGKYTYCRSNKEVNYHHTAASIRDNFTTFINKHSQNSDINHGLMIEIIPLDGCPNSKIERIKQMIYAMVYSLFNAQRLPNNQGKFLRIMSWFLLTIFRSPNLRYNIWKYSEKQMTKYRIEDCEYITELVTGFKYLKLEYPKKIFKTAIYKEFEGYQLPVPIGYDTYLKMAFGDYMKFPPENKRVPKHDTVYINLNESYKNFKGIYYCLNKP